MIHPPFILPGHGDLALTNAEQATIARNSVQDYLDRSNRRTGSSWRLMALYLTPRVASGGPRGCYGGWWRAVATEYRSAGPEHGFYWRRQLWYTGSRWTTTRADRRVTGRMMARLGKLPS